MLEDEVPEMAREVLGRAKSSAAFDMKLTDADTMGFPIAYYLAMWLAEPERGNGVVEYEGKWWDAASYDELS
jgi:hypothetical protein